MDAARAPDELIDLDPPAADEARTAADDISQQRDSDEAMATREIGLPDGRYLVFYTFGDAAEALG